MSRSQLTPFDDEEATSDPPATLRDQREANEHLVLAAVRAMQETEDALVQRVLAEQQREGLRATADELQTTAELRERLIGIIGHDLRTPLSAMTMAASMLLSRGNLDVHDQRLAIRIRQSGERVARMIGQLLDFTLARAGGGFELRRSRTDLGQVCHTIADELRLSTGIEVREDTSGDLTGYWDADRLAAVLSNLGSNAVRHSQPGAAVFFRSHAENDQVTAQVTNFGVCIPPEVLPDIFEPFRRATNDSGTRAGHLGLGLYIACQIARAHHGSISVESADGATTFTLRLPRDPPESRSRPK